MVDTSSMFHRFIHPSIITIFTKESSKSPHCLLFSFHRFPIVNGKRKRDKQCGQEVQIRSSIKQGFVIFPFLEILSSTHSFIPWKVLKTLFRVLFVPDSSLTKSSSQMFRRCMWPKFLQTFQLPFGLEELNKNCWCGKNKVWKLEKFG